MKKFRNSRDDGRFALNTLQNPTLEVRSLHQLIAAAEQVLPEDAAGQPARPIPPEEQLSPEDATADHALSELAPLENAVPAPETTLDSAESPEPQSRPRRKTRRRKFARFSMLNF